MSGIYGVSICGGAEIMIYGQEFSHSPIDNVPNFKSLEFSNSQKGPKLTSTIFAQLFII
jgi:hypothetical protein